MSIKVAVVDAFGGSIEATRDPLTGYIFLDVRDGRSGEEEKFSVDPGEPDVLAWLKKVFQPIHLDILLDK
jgi:hypothetical protein